MKQPRFIPIGEDTPFSQQFKAGLDRLARALNVEIPFCNSCYGDKEDGCECSEEVTR